MRIALTSVPAHGHINPTLPMVRELTQRGHSVLYATNERMRETVEAAGAELVPLPGEMPTNPRELTPEQRAQQFLNTARMDFSPLCAALEREQPDVLCYDMMTPVGRMTSEKMGVPGAALIPTYASNEHFSLHRDVLSSSSETTPANLTEMFQRMQEALDELSEELDVTVRGPFDTTPDGLNIVFLPREFQFAAYTFDERFAFVGPSMGPRMDTERWEPKDPNRPVLFVSLGTVFNDQPEFFQTCMRAFADSDWQVAMAIGQSVHETDLGPIPDNVEVRPHFPQTAVLRRADAFISHTGMNSTMEAMYFGVPIVAVPQQPEQEANARQVANLGVGRHLNTNALTAEQLRATVEEVRADQDVHANMNAMSTTVRSYDGAPSAADAVEQYVTATNGAAANAASESA